MTQITQHFSIAEMACKCCGKCFMNPAFMEKLEHYRLDLDMGLTVTSGYRCEAHNAAVGGKSGSQHLDGHAVDLGWKFLDGFLRYKMLKTAFEHEFTGIGISDNFLHLDDRLRGIAMWTYPQRTKSPGS